jgi:hypothetical protein
VFGHSGSFGCGRPRALAGFVLNVDGVGCSLSFRYDHSVLHPVVPPSLRACVSAFLHSQAFHLQPGTVSAAKSSYHWPGMIQDLELFCRQCPHCLRPKTSTAPSQAQEGTITLLRVNDAERIDLLTLPPTAEGYKHLMVVENHFSRYVSATPLKSKSDHDTLKTFKPVDSPH